MGNQPHGMEFWEDLNRVLQNEPVVNRNRFILTQLRGTGIEKAKAFKPTKEQQDLFIEAEKMGNAIAMVTTFSRESYKERHWPDRNWPYILNMKYLDHYAPNYYEVQEIASYTYEAITTSKGMLLNNVGSGSKYLGAYLDDKGLPVELGAYSLMLIGLFNIIGAFVCGWLGGVVSKKKSLATVYLLRGITIAAFILIPPTPLTALLFGACMGLLWLGTIPLTSGLIVVFFGPRYLSMLYGLVFLSHQIGSFVGAWFGGIWYDWFGNYETMWWLNAAAGLFAFVVNWAIREPRPAAAAA